MLFFIIIIYKLITIATFFIIIIRNAYMFKDNTKWGENKKKADHSLNFKILYFFKKKFFSSTDIIIFPFSLHIDSFLFFFCYATIYSTTNFSI